MLAGELPVLGAWRGKADLGPFDRITLQSDGGEMTAAG